MKTENSFKGKSEIAQKLKISTRWLAYYLNVLWYSELKEIGYNKYSHVLEPEIVNFIYEKFVVTD